MRQKEKKKYTTSLGNSHPSNKKINKHCIRIEWRNKKKSSIFSPFHLPFHEIDADDSDSDSESVIMENGVDQQTVYAEVLYAFKAVGAEELSLERGALVEVLRMESGPWWLGRIKHDAILLSEKNELRQGWFPRDFVKVNTFQWCKSTNYTMHLIDSTTFALK